MSKLKLEIIDTKGLQVFSTPCDVRQDVHAFVDYVSTRTIKRAHRSNRLSKTDTNRVAKLMTYPNMKEQIARNSWFTWID